MSLAKKSQDLSLDGVDILISPLDDKHKLDVALLDDVHDLASSAIKLPEVIIDSDDDLVVTDEPESSIEVEEPALVLTLDHIPGGIDQEEIEEPAEIEVEEDDNEVVVNNDPWDWGGDHAAFLAWLSNMMHSVPPHSGRDTVGLERTIAYFKRLDKEISRAARSDHNSRIDIQQLEKARDEILRAIDRLEDRLEKVQGNKYPKNKKKKKAEEDQDGFVKEAQKATHVGGIVVSVPLLISGLARVCINGTVSGGHDIEDMFQKLAKKFNLTDREKFEMIQLISDMGYAIRRDRGFLLDEDHNPSDQDGFDWNQNFPA